jgi:hypothetical protein
VKQLAGERESLVTEVERLRTSYSSVVSQAMELEVVLRSKEVEAEYREKVIRDQDESIQRMRRKYEQRKGRQKRDLC